MKVIRLCAASLALILSAAALSACVSQSTHVAGAAPVGVPVAEASLVREYADDDALLSEATLLIVGQPVASREELIADVPFTVVTFAVDEAVGRDAPMATRTVDVRYSGGAKLSFSGLPALPYQGLRYVLLLQPFTFDGSSPTGQFIVVGPGQWVRDGRSSDYALDVIAFEPAPGSTLPVVLSTAQLSDLSAEVAEVGVAAAR